MLVKHSVRGGEGGRAGTHGQGGSAGSGGSGGSSYSWSESEDYTDSNGQRQTRSTSHYNSGGSAGPSGNDGRSGAGHLMAGREGRRGELSVAVQGAGGAVGRYSSFYDMRLGSLAHDSENQDGVHEPEERIFVKDIVVVNSGGMPTPTRPIQIRLLENEWVVPENAQIDIPKRLESGEQIVLPGPLSFIVKPVQITSPSEAFSGEGNIQLAATLPAVSRVFEAFDSAFDPSLGRFAVRFPLQLSPIEALHSMAAGEQARLAFSLFNVSKRSFGERGEVPRLVAWNLALEDSQVDASQVSFELTSHDAALASGESLEAGIARFVDLIEPGKPIELAGTIGLSADARPYEAVRFLLALKLGRPNAPSSLNRIHLQAFVVRVAERFRSCEQADVVLIVHNRTQRDELDAWKSVASQMDLQCAVWDVSLEGHFDLDRTVGSSVLSQHFEGKTLIVLNGGFDTPRGERNAYELAEADALLQHAARGGSTVVIGSKNVRMDWALTPYERLDAKKTPIESDLSVDHIREHTAALEPAGGGASFPVIKTRWFGSPSAQELSEAAAVVARLADAAHPGRRHVVTHRHGSGESEPSGFARNYNIGSVRLERTLDVGARGTVYIALSADQLHDPDHVTSSIAPLALAMGLAQDKRLAKLQALAANHRGPFETFDYLSKNAAPVTSWLRHGIAFDLASEQHEAIVRPGFSATAVLPELDRLKTFALRETPSTQTEDVEDGRPGPSAIVAVDSPEGVVWIEALAVARGVAWGFVRWWMFFPPLFVFLVIFGKAFALHRRVRRQTSEIAERVFGQENAGAAIRAVAKAARALRTRTRTGPGNCAQRIRDTILAPLEACGLRPLAASTSIVMSDDDHLTFDDVRKRQHKRRRGIASALSQARSELLVAAAPEVSAAQGTKTRVAAPAGEDPSRNVGDAFGDEAEREEEQPVRLGRA